MESRKDLYNKNASEKGVDMVSLDRDTMIRISKNPGWYQALYKSYGCAPNATELYDIAHKKMKNEVYYNMDKNDAEGMDEKETMEAARRRVESHERIKDIVDKFDDGDMVAQSLLNPETYEQVYKPTVETLSRGNAVVKKSARESALILSKTAENFPKNYGVPLKMAAVKTAEESSAAAGAYKEPAFDVRKTGTNSVSGFLKKVEQLRLNRKEPNKIFYTGKYGVLYSAGQIYHASIFHHGHKLTPEELDNIEQNINILHNIGTSKQGKGLFHGKSVLSRVDGQLGSYYLVLEVAPNGVVWFKTGMAGSKESIDKIIAEHSARSLTPPNVGEQGSASQNDSAITIDRLPKSLGFVKKNFLHQMAGENAKTANMKALKQAKRMLRSGESIEEISKETGWFVGMDGRWRFYIPDHLDQFNSRK